MDIAVSDLKLEQAQVKAKVAQLLKSSKIFRSLSCTKILIL
jgi:hypothetical protein